MPRWRQQRRGDFYHLAVLTARLVVHGGGHFEEKTDSRRRAATYEETHRNSLNTPATCTRERDRVSTQLSLQLLKNADSALHDDASSLAELG